jgi:hypothetical protein
MFKPAPTKQFLEELEKIKAGVGNVGDDIFPSRLPKELSDIIDAVVSSCERLESRIRTLDQQESRAMYHILVKRQRAEALLRKNITSAEHLAI